MKAVPAYIRIAEQIKADWLNESGSDSLRDNKLPSQEELAAHYAVSRSTIVRSLSRLVAEGVLRSQQGSGVYRESATLPQESRSSQLALIVPTLNSPLIFAACRGIERRARQMGLQVTLSSFDFSYSLERELVERYRAARVKGIILYPAIRWRDDLPADYLNHWQDDVPLVTLDLGCDEWNCTRVEFDNARLGYDMTRQMLRHGYRKIAFMHAIPGRMHTSILEREQGWAKAMHESGQQIPDNYRNWSIPVRSVPDTAYPDFDFAVGVRRLLELSPRPDSVIAWNDWAAVTLREALDAVGTPEACDIRVAGFDCEPLFSRTDLMLFPTSRPDFVHLGEMAVEKLQEIVETRSVGRRTLPRVYKLSVPVLWRGPRRESGNEIEDFSGDSVWSGNGEYRGDYSTLSEILKDFKPLLSLP